MKKMTLLLMLVIVAMISFGLDKTGTIRTGKTMLDVPMSFSALDAVLTGETTNIIVYSEQVNPSKQNMYSALTVSSGSPSVAIKLWGKCFSGDAYVQIGSTQTWTSTSNNPVNISAVTPNQYRYFKAEYVCTGTGGVTITAFELKLWLTSGLASSGTLTDGTATINSGALAGATTGAFSGAVTVGGALGVTGAINGSAGVSLGTSQALVGTTAMTIGNNAQTVAVNSSDWDISAAGNLSGIGTIVTDGTIDNVVTNTVAGGDKGLNIAITQDATALTGNLIGAGIVATNGTSAAANGVVYGIEAKARAATSANAGNTISRLTGVYASVDAKNKEATTMRAFEASLDGGAGGTSTEAVAFEAFNNSSATQTASYAFSANGGTAGGHKAYTHDVRLQLGEFIDNTTDGSLTMPNIINKHTAVAVNSDATVSAATMLAGLITSTSGAATGITTPTATAIAALIPGCGRGTTFDLIIDNSAGSNTVTLVLDGSIAVVTPAITGGATLTVSTANVIGLFRFYFTSGTAAKVFRIY